MAMDAKTITVTGLGTYAFSVLDAGVKNVRGKITLPNFNNGSPANSQVVVTVNLNGGAALYTGTPGDEGFETAVGAQPGDVVNVVLSSSLAQDKAINVIKSTLSFG